MVPPAITLVLDGSDVEFDVDAGVVDVDVDADVNDVEVEDAGSVEVASAIQENLLITSAL